MPCYKPILGWAKKGGGFTTSLRDGYKSLKRQIPCGQCIGCRLEKRRQWAMRLTHESKLYDISSFLTVTYDEEHLPMCRSICKRHPQLFIKRLRKYLEPAKIRYFTCGEYGDDEKYEFRSKYGGNTGRPHYHILVFDYWPEDAREIPHKKSKQYKLYHSEKLSKIWGKGSITIGEVNFDSASYAAKYCTKKQTGEKGKNFYQGKLPEFATMSRRPGIGYGWYKKYKEETWRDDYVIINNNKMQPPLYYKNKLKEENRDAHFEKKVNAKKKINEEETTFQRLDAREKFKEKQTSFFEKSIS